MIPSGLTARLLIGFGMVLFIVAGVSAYPYVHSRVIGPSSMNVTAAPPRVPSALPSTSEGPNSAQAQSGELRDTPAPSPTASPAVVSISPPTPTPSPPEPGPQKPDGARPTRVVIPTIKVDGPVVPVSLHRTEVSGHMQAMWGVPDQYAAGWHETSAALGQRGNLVLNGHNTTNGEIFRDLYTLERNDEIIVYSEEISRTYTVSEALVLPEAGQPLDVRLANARYVMPTDNERLTLVTCHPYGSLRNRLIVIARPSKSELYSEPLED